MRTQHGRYTRLDPPIIIDGVTYGAAVKFDPDRPPQIVCSGVIHSVEEVSSGRYRIVAAHGVQSSDYDIPPAAPGEGSINVVYQCATGGNICQTPESGRVYSHANDRACRGPEADRALPGADGFRLRKGGKLYPLARVLVADAFAEPPAAVSWHVVNAQTNAYVDLQFYADLRTVDQLLGYVDSATGQTVPAVGRLHFDPDDSFLTGIIRVDGTDLVRHVFQIDGVDDPEYYPTNAAFPSGTEYWLSPTTGELRLSWRAVPVAGGDLQRFYWVRNIRGRYTAAADALMAVLGDATRAGYGEAGDLLARSVYPEASDTFDRTVYLAKGLGTASVEIREGQSNTGRVLAVRFNEDGQLVSTVVRNGGYATDAVVDAGEWPRTVRLQRSGDNLTISVDGDVITTAEFIDCGLTFVGVASTRGAQWLAPAATWQPNDATELAVLRSRVDPVERRVTHSALDQTIESIVLEQGTETGVPMVPANPPLARNQYRSVSGGLIFSIESSGDQIRVAYTAAAAPTGTGRPPRVVSNQVNWATAEEGGATSTTDVDENRMNWRDAIEIRWELPGQFPGVEGDQFEIIRGGVFSTGDSLPVIEYDIKTEEETTWATVPSGDMLLLAWDGLVLLKESWRAALTGPVCFRARGQRMITRPAFDATLWEERRRIIDGLENLWTACGRVGLDNAVAGNGYMYVGFTTATCKPDNSGLVYTNAAWGFPREVKPEDAENSIWPMWLIDVPVNNSIALQGDGFSSRLNENPTVGCGAFEYNSVEIEEGNNQWKVYPYGYAPPVTPEWPIYFGCLPAFGEDPDDGFTEITAGFLFPAFAFGPGDVLATLPEGTECLEAKMEVYFTGLSGIDYEWSESFESPAEDAALETVRVTYSSRGTVYYDKVGDTVVINTGHPGELTGGTLGFKLMAYKQKSSFVVDQYDNPITVPDRVYTSLGGTTVSFSSAAAASDEPFMVDVTSAIQALLDARGGNYSGFELWVANGASTAADGDGVGLSGYVRSLFGQRSATSTHWGNGSIRTLTKSGVTRFTAADTLALGTVLARFRLPDSVVESRVLHMFQPPATPALE